MKAITEVIKCLDADELKDKVENLRRLISLSDGCFANQLFDICSSLASKANILPDVEKECIVPLVKLFLSKSQLEWNKIAQNSVVILIEQGIISKECFEHFFCDTFVESLNSSTVDDFRIETINNISKILHHVSKDVIIIKILPTFINLCEDTSAEIKRTCVSLFGKIATLIGPESTEKLILPLYQKLSKEELPDVRKACVDVSVTLSYLCSHKVRNEVLAPLFIKFLTDETRYVMDCALISMGPFIATFADPHKTGLYYSSNGKVTSRTREETIINNDQSSSSDSGCVMTSTVCEENEPSLDNLFPSLSIQDDVEDDKEPLQKLDAMYNQFEKTFGEAEINAEIEDTITAEVNSTVEEADEEESNRSPPDNRSDQTENDLKDEELSFYKEQSFDSDSPPSSPSREKPPPSAEFNNFLYWRQPLPNIEHELALRAQSSDSGRSMNANGVFKSKTCQEKLSPEQMDMLQIQKCILDPEILPEYYALFPELYPSLQHQAQTALMTSPTDQDIVPGELLEHFLRMATMNYLSNFFNTDITYHCAYSLPAVAFTLGPENWHCLRRTFTNLVLNMSANIRCILSASLYPIAMIIGSEHTSLDLFPALLIFMRDTDEVRSRILPNLAQIVKMLKKEEQVIVLTKLYGFLKQDHVLNWRYRLSFAQQLGEMVPLFTEPAYFNKYVLPLVFQLLQDDVAKVRKSAVVLVSLVIKHLHEPSLFLCEESLNLKVRIFTLLRDIFAMSKKWSTRQTYVLICEQIMVNGYLPMDICEKNLSEHLFTLSKDPVANVRLPISRMISRMASYEIFQLMEHAHFRQTITSLMYDQDHDVRDFLTNVEQELKVSFAEELALKLNKLERSKFHIKEEFLMSEILAMEDFNEFAKEAKEEESEMNVDSDDVHQESEEELSCVMDQEPDNAQISSPSEMEISEQSAMCEPLSAEICAEMPKKMLNNSEGETLVQPLDAVQDKEMITKNK